MKDCPTILSLEILCNEEGWNYSSKNREDPVLWKDKVVIRLHSKQKVPMMYAAASTGIDHSTGPGSKSHPDSVSSSNQDPPHSTQDSSTSQSSNSSSSSTSSSPSSGEEVDGQPSTSANTSASDERSGTSADTLRSIQASRRPLRQLHRRRRRLSVSKSNRLPEPTQLYYPLSS